jgi:hypothetical protein
MEVGAKYPEREGRPRLSLPSSSNFHLIDFS